MLTITLAPGPAALPGGECLLQVTLHNDGEALELANPAALLHEPRWRLTHLPGGTAVEASNWQNFAPPAGQLPRLQLAAGGHWQATLPLRLPQGQRGPGLWQAQLLMSTPQGVVASEPCLLQVQDWQLRGGDAQHGAPPFGEIEGDALLLHHSGRLYRMLWAADDSFRRGHGGAEPLALLDVAPDACDLLVPARDAPFWSDPARWLLWREGAVVHAVGTSGQRQALTLPKPPAMLLRPALQRDQGPVEVFALAAERREVLRLHLDRAASTPPQVVQTLDLPLPVAAGCAAFAPNSGSLLGLVAAVDGGVALLLYRDSGLQQARWEGGGLLPACAPTVRAHADSSVHVAALAQHGAEVLIVSARFGSDGATLVQSTPIGTAATPVVAGALVLVPAHAAHADQDDDDGDVHGHGHNHGSHGARLAYVVLELADGTWMRLGDDGLLEAAEFEAPPVHPLTLAVGGHGAFVLACDAALGPFMAEA